MKRTEAQSIGDIIHDVFRQAGLEEAEARQRALYSWGDVVGPGIVKKTTRRFVDASGVMHVYIASAPLKADLQFMRSQLLLQLNAAVGCNAITDLIIH